MFEKLNSFKGWLSAIFATIGAVLGLRGILFVAMLGVMLIDTVLGWVYALKSGTWKSEKARDGAGHKFGSIAVVIVCGIMDLCLQVICGLLPDMPFLWVNILFPVSCTWYILTEIGSIIENCVLLGAPVPAWLLKVLEVGKKIVDTMGDSVSGENS